MNEIRILLGLSFLFFITIALSGCAEKERSPDFILILTDDQSWVGTSYLSDPDDPRSWSLSWIRLMLKQKEQKINSAI